MTEEKWKDTVCRASGIKGSRTEITTQEIVPPSKVPSPVQTRATVYGAFGICRLPDHNCHYPYELIHVPTGTLVSAFDKNVRAKIALILLSELNIDWFSVSTTNLTADNRMACLSAVSAAMNNDVALQIAGKGKV